MAMGQSPTKNFSAVAYDEAGNKRKIALITGVTGQVSFLGRERGRERGFFSFFFLVIATAADDDARASINASFSLSFRPFPAPPTA